VPNKEAGGITKPAARAGGGRVFLDFSVYALGVVAAAGVGGGVGDA